MPLIKWKAGATTTSPAPRKWRRWRLANIGIVTGRFSDVLDIDGPDVLDALERSGPYGAPDIEGPCAVTVHGWHVHGAVTGRGNTVNLGGIKGLDYRGKGGMVVAPPSRRPDGTYDWLERGPATPIRPWPAWVMALFEEPEHSRVTAPLRHAGRTGYGAAAMRDEVERVMAATEPGRNDTLNDAAFSLGQLAAEGCLSPAEIGDTLYDAALSIGLGAEEAEKTIMSGLTAGLANPRRRKIP